VCASAALTIASPAGAENLIKSPGDHPDYHVELEPHVLFGVAELYGATGLGVGLRASIPIVQNGFVPQINNSVAISFGLDWTHYGDCYYFDRRNGRDIGYGCGANYFIFPVAMQWNFWFTEHWSAFGEPGLYIYHGVFDANYCDPNFQFCGYPTATGVDFAFWVGGRYHFNDKVSLTMRIGYPSFSFGVSFFP
jgi:hypothetical protein